MKALNLYTLTRIKEHEDFSRLEQILSGRAWRKKFSAHEVASLCVLVDAIVRFLEDSSRSDAAFYPDWVSCFDGFYFSYTIEHISKEFDLLKLSPDGGCVLNIELKSESIEEDRISRQLEQNRYYLSHIAKTILSYTFVMETDTLYCLNDHGYLKRSDISELVQVLKRPGLRKYVKTEIGQYFRAQDYLISPVSTPQKYLTGRYFLTNQQSEFRRQILEILSSRGTEQEGAQKPDKIHEAGATAHKSPGEDARHIRKEADRILESGRSGGASDLCGTGEPPVIELRDGASEKYNTEENPAIELGNRASETYYMGEILAIELRDGASEKRGTGEIPVISLTGSAGTGKTLLLFDLARELSRKRRVLFLHGGPLRDGHRLIDKRLHKVKIQSGTDPRVISAICGEYDLSAYSVILVDEANRFSSEVLEGLFEKSRASGIPCVFSFDPHSILGPIPPMQEAEMIIGARETLRLELSGNIRINRPVFSFLRTLFHQKDRAGYVDYSCIDILYAGNKEEERALTAHYLALGYKQISASYECFQTGEIISQEYDKVLMVMDRRFYYDENRQLCARGGSETAMSPLYEGLSRAREKLCLVISGNRKLFSQVLAIRMMEEKTRD